MDDLVKKAKSYRERSNGVSKMIIDKKEMPLMMAYLNGEVSTREYAHALGVVNAGSVTHRVPVVLKEALLRGWITIKLK